MPLALLKFICATIAWVCWYWCERPTLIYEDGYKYTMSRKETLLLIWGGTWRVAEMKGLRKYVSLEEFIHNPDKEKKLKGL